MRPRRFTLAELGPGRGTLMADILRATRGVPGFHAAAQAGAGRSLAPAARPAGRDPGQVGGPVPAGPTRSTDLPEAPLFLVANEFFDALPIRQFQRGPQGWQERLVGLRDDACASACLRPCRRSRTRLRFAARPDGDAGRGLPAGAGVVAADCAPGSPGTAGWPIVIDYGGWRSQGDTLQALRPHAFDDPLAHPGEADLTAHVDFEPLAGTGARPLPMTRKARF